MTAEIARRQGDETWLWVIDQFSIGPKANWLDNPLPVSITRRTVTSATRLRVVLAPGGGQAIRIRPSK